MGRDVCVKIIISYQSIGNGVHSLTKQISDDCIFLAWFNNKIMQDCLNLFSFQKHIELFDEEADKMKWYMDF